MTEEHTGVSTCVLLNSVSSHGVCANKYKLKQAAGEKEGKRRSYFPFVLTRTSVHVETFQVTSRSVVL